jgi:hypothetical protein
MAKCDNTNRRDKKGQVRAFDGSFMTWWRRILSIMWSLILRRMVERFWI